ASRIKEPWLRDLEQFRRRLVKLVFLDRASLKRCQDGVLRTAGLGTQTAQMDDSRLAEQRGMVVESGNRIRCTLWDDYAVKMQQFLDSHDPYLPLIIILQLCKLKKFLGSMGISNSFYGSESFLNAEIPEMNAANVELTQLVSQTTGPALINVAHDLLQTPKMTIEDLIESTQVNGNC
ncbi:replication protein A 70 kDa DNA-binding subunit, partial [Trifolium pratense]